MGVNYQTQGQQQCTWSTKEVVSNGQLGAESPISGEGKNRLSYKTGWFPCSIMDVEVFVWSSRYQKIPSRKIIQSTSEPIITQRGLVPLADRSRLPYVSQARHGDYCYHHAPLKRARKQYNSQYDVLLCEYSRRLECSAHEFFLVDVTLATYRFRSTSAHETLKTVAFSSCVPA